MNYLIIGLWEDVQVGIVMPDRIDAPGSYATYKSVSCSTSFQELM